MLALESPKPLKPNHRLIREYYSSLRDYEARGFKTEGTVRSAFERLLDDTARSAGWRLANERPHHLEGKSVYPDGTVYDGYNLPRGYWEAKDADDDLDAEIRKKKGKDYPLSNIIFENTKLAVLYQNRREVMRVELAEPPKLAELINQFYAWTEPEYAKFDTAVKEFTGKVPAIAMGLANKIRAAYKQNTKYRAAFDDFFALCQASLNPNIRREAVEEMLVQHLLTERVIRKCLDVDDFTKRNVIAAKVEEVIRALVIGKAFNREEFQESLAPFFKAIEGAAAQVPEYRDKQGFLRAVYERFFQGYSVKVADTHGIVYTPEKIVDFMCGSVEEVLKDEFGLTLGSPQVIILDPCTGTGNFVTNLIRRVSGRDLPRVYREQLFANEVMLLPYYIAALNIERAYFDRTEEYEAFEGVCFVDTLELAEPEQQQFEEFSEKNSERVNRQKKTPITVIVGNPPYNVGQLSENDNNKNRKYPIIERRIRETYAKGSKASNVNKLWDPYVKFFRWASDRIGNRDGVLCFVSNNSFAATN